MLGSEKLRQRRGESTKGSRGCPGEQRALLTCSFNMNLLSSHCMPGKVGGEVHKTTVFVLCP